MSLRHTPKEHLDNFYCLFDDIKDKQYDGLIVTGAPLGINGLRKGQLLGQNL